MDFCAHHQFHLKARNMFLFLDTDAFGHAKELMELEDKNKQLEVCKKVVKENLSIKDTALLVDQARPAGELTEREKELNRIEKDIIK